MPRIPIGRIAAVLAIVVAIVVLTRGGSTPRFRSLAPGVEFAHLRGDPYCRQGSSHIAVLRVDPARTRWRVRHYRREGPAPIDILEWQRRTGALAVFNAGQYYPDWTYMGLLVSDGTRVSPIAHPTFKAALVADPVRGGGRRAQVLDLEETRLDPARPAWREVAQSFMLFDRRGEVRVRNSPQIALRTVVAEDSDHRLLVISTEGAYTLHDFALLLQSAPLGLTHAMSMDGGSEAQLCVRAGKFHYANFGPWNPASANPLVSLVPLPAVVTVSTE